MTRIWTALLAAGMLLLAVPAAAQELTEDRVRQLVLETIRENPGIVMEAVAILQAQEAEAQAGAQAEVLNEQREILERDPNAPVFGNPDGDVTIVEFFDYNCPYCRRAMPELEVLLESDPNVRMVMREWPILGEGSVFAARAALAARKQGLYEEFHWAMMGMEGRAEEPSVLDIAESVGLDIQRLQQDMNAPEVDEHIATTMRLARDLGFTGTPSFVIGDQLVPGLVESARLIRLVNQVREDQAN